MIEYGRNTLGPNARIYEPVTIGFPSRDRIGCENFRGAIIGRNACCLVAESCRPAQG